MRQGIEASKATRERILATVKPGRAYSPTDIGTNIRMRVDSIRHHIEQLVTEGKLTRIAPKPGTRTPTFCIPGTLVEQSAMTVDPDMIAQPRYYDVFKGSLSGYESEIARRTALCMVTRGQR